MTPTEPLVGGPAPRLAWLPPLLVAASAAIASEVAVSILLYGGAGFVRSLTTILATIGFAFSMGLWSAPKGTRKLVDRLRRRWVFCLFAYLAAAAYGTAWSLVESVGSARWGQAVGLTLVAALPLYASGSVLGGLSEAARTDAGRRLPGPGASAALGATLGILATGFLLPRAPMPASLLIVCLVMLSLGGMAFGGVLASRTEVEEQARRPGRPHDVRVLEVRRGLDDVARRDLVEGTQLRRTMPLEATGRPPWDVSAVRAVLPDLDAPCRVLLLGSGASAAPRAILREHPSARVHVLERTAATVELGRDWFSTELSVGEDDRLVVSAGNLDDAISALEPGIDILVVDRRGIAPIGGIAGLSERSRELLVERLSPGGLMIWGPGPREAGDPESPRGWSSTLYRRGVGPTTDENVLMVRSGEAGGWPEPFDDFAPG